MMFMYLLCIQGVEAGDIATCNTIEFLKFIPTITCCSPKDTFSHTQPSKSKILHAILYCVINK